MATYIQGLTGNAPQIQQFKPDHNFYQSVLTLKQNQYDQGLQQVSSLYGSALDVELTRSDNKEKKQEFFDQIEGGIKKLAGLDLSLKQNVEQAYGLFNQFLHDESIQHDAWFTKTSNDELAKAKAYKNCMNPEECGGMWWEGGERLIRLSMKAYEDATAEEAMSMLPQEYVPAQNIHKIATDYIKELGIDKTVEYIDDSKTFVVKDKNGEIVNDEIAEVLNGVLWSDPRIQQFYTAQQKLDRLEFVMLNKDKFGSMDVANAAYYGMKQKQIIDGLKLQNQFYEYDIERGNYKDDDEKNIILSTIERNKAKIENIKQKNDVLLSIANAVLKYNEDNSNPLDIDDGTTNTSNDSIKKQIEEYMQIDKGITASLDRINALYEQSISEGIFNPDFSPEQLDFNMANFMFSLFVTDYSPVLSNLWSTHSHKKWGTPLRGGKSGSGMYKVVETFTGKDGTRNRVSYNTDKKPSKGSSSNTSGGKKRGSGWTVGTGKFGGQLPIYQDEGEVVVSKSLDAAKNKTPYPDSLFTEESVMGPYTNLQLKEPQKDQLFINYGLAPFEDYEPQYVSYPENRPLAEWLTYAHGIEEDKTNKFKDIDTEGGDKTDVIALKKNRFLFEHRCTYGQFMNAAKKGIFSTSIFEETASDRVYSDLRLNVRVLSGNKSFRHVNLFRQNAEDDMKNPHAGAKFRNYDASKGKIDAGNVILQDTEEGYEINVKSQLDNVVSNFMQLEKVLNAIGEKKALKPIIQYSGWGNYIKFINDTTITPQGDTIIREHIGELSNYSSSPNPYSFNIDERLTSTSRDTSAYKQYYPEIKSGSEFLNSIITLLAQTGNYEMSNFVMQGAFSMSSQLDDQIQMHYNFMNETLNSMLEIIQQGGKPNIYEFFDIPQDKFVNVTDWNVMGGHKTILQKLTNPYDNDESHRTKDNIYELKPEQIEEYNSACTKFNLLRNFLCFNNLSTLDQSTNPGGLLFSSVSNWDSFISSDDANIIKEYMSDELDGNSHFSIKEGEANVKRLDGKDYFLLSPIELELMNNSTYESDESDVNNYKKALNDAQEKSKNYFNEKGISYEFDEDGTLKVTKTTDKYSASVNITPEVAQNIIHGYNINTFSVVAENYGLRTDFDFHDNLVLPNGEVQPPNPNAITIGDKKKIIDDLGKDLPELFNHRTEAFKYEKTGLLGTITDMWSMMMGFDERPDFEPYKIWGSSGEGKSNRYQYENQENVSVLAKIITDAWHGLYSWSLNKNKSRYVNLGDIYNNKEGYGKTYKVTVDYNNVNGTNEFDNEPLTLADDVACNYFSNFLSSAANAKGTLPTVVIKCYKDSDGKIVRWPLTTEDHQNLIKAGEDKITTDITGELSKFSDYTSKKKFDVYVSPIANDDQRYMGVHITGFKKSTDDGIDYDGLTVYVPMQNVMHEQFAHQVRNNLFELCLPGCNKYQTFSNCLRGNFVFEKRNDNIWYLTTMPSINDVDISSMYDILNVGDMRYRGYNLRIGQLPGKVEPSYVTNPENINKDFFYEWRTYGIPDYDFPNMMRLFNERLIYLDGLMSKSAIQRLSESYKNN